MKGLNTGAEPGPAPILQRLADLADPIRCRLLLLLDGQELTVTEICSVLQLPQSTVSRHLKLLAGDGWVSVRPEGTSRFYSAALERHDDSARQLWELVAEQVSDTAAAAQDRRRLEAVVARRHSRSQEFFSSSAGRWAEVRRELFGDAFDLGALPGLLDDRWVVGDLGCGIGQTSERLAPFVREIVAVDESEAMLEAARRRLASVDNVELRQGRLERLPIADGELDAATLMLVLHHAPEPRQLLTEAARALVPGGRLLLVDMLPHDREEYRAQMGHVWLGFAAEQLEGWLREAGFGRVRLVPLPADPEAKGPALFAATAVKPPGTAATEPESPRPNR